MKKLLLIIVIVLFQFQIFSQVIQKTYINLEEVNQNVFLDQEWVYNDNISDEFNTINISNPYSDPYYNNPNLDMVNKKWHWCPSWGIADYNAPYYCKKDNIETTVYSEPDANNYIKLWTKYEPDGFEHPNPSNYNDYYPTYTLFTLNNGFSEKKQKNFI